MQEWQMLDAEYVVWQICKKIPAPAGSCIVSSRILLLRDEFKSDT